MNNLKELLMLIPTFLLNISFWKEIGFVLTPILTVVMIVYYVSLWYWKWKEKKNSVQTEANE